ncbi:MAG: hypothetical protein AAFZ15_29930 [Bacteroidota bacterium]
MLYRDPHIIDEYLTGRMTEEARIAFEKELQQDAELQTAVEERKVLIAVIDSLGDIEMKKRAKRIHQKAMVSTTRVRKVAFWKYAAAAVFVLLFAVSIWIYRQPASPADLYARHYEPYGLSFAIRNPASGQQLSQASTYYGNGDYQAAIPVFEGLLNQEISNKDQVRLALGICQMELSNDEGALNYFQLLIDNPSSPYFEQGLWYAALLSLRSANILTAKKYLNELIRDEDSFYFDDANELLNDLN